MLFVPQWVASYRIAKKLRNWRSEKGKRSAAGQSGGSGAQNAIWEWEYKTVTLHKRHLHSYKMCCTCQEYKMWFSSLSCGDLLFRSVRLSLLLRKNSPRLQGCKSKDAEWWRSVRDELICALFRLCLDFWVCLCDTATVGNLWWFYSKALVDSKDVNPNNWPHAHCHTRSRSRSQNTQRKKRASRARARKHTHAHGEERRPHGDSGNPDARMRLDDGWLLC